MIREKTTFVNSQCKLGRADFYFTIADNLNKS